MYRASSKSNVTISVINFNASHKSKVISVNKF